MTSLLCCSSESKLTYLSHFDHLMIVGYGSRGILIFFLHSSKHNLLKEKKVTDFVMEIYSDYGKWDLTKTLFLSFPFTF